MPFHYTTTAPEAVSAGSLVIWRGLILTVRANARHTGWPFPDGEAWHTLDFVPVVYGQPTQLILRAESLILVVAYADDAAPLPILPCARCARPATVIGRAAPWCKACHASAALPAKANHD